MLSLFIVAACTVQKAEMSKTLKDALMGRRYIFSAVSASPASGTFRNLTPGYTLEVRGDSLQVYLPYFGRAYSAPVSNEGGIRVSTSDISYVTEQDNKGRWNIHIVPKNDRDVRTIYIQVSPSGSATVQVTSNNRQPISFRGQVEPLGSSR